MSSFIASSAEPDRPTLVDQSPAVTRRIFPRSIDLFSADYNVDKDGQRDPGTALGDGGKLGGSSGDVPKIFAFSGL